MLSLGTRSVVDQGRNNAQGMEWHHSCGGRICGRGTRRRRTGRARRRAPSTALLKFVADGPAVPGLSGLNENPQHPESSATGTTTVFWDTTTSSMTVIVGFTGLTTPNTAAHIHCCATAPGNAGVATTTPTFTGFPGGVTGGSYTRTFNMLDAASYNPAFVSPRVVSRMPRRPPRGLQAGRAYMNIHSQMFGGGEVRGFLHPAPCLTGVQFGPLTVAAGEAVCVAPGAMVLGPITVNPGGALALDGAFVAGPIEARNATFVRVCGSTVAGPLTVSGSTGLVLVGGDAATGPCAGNTIMGPGSLTNNSAGVEFNGNLVMGPLTISGTTGSLPPPDTGSVHATGNTVLGPTSITHSSARSGAPALPGAPGSRSFLSGTIDSLDLVELVMDEVPASPAPPLEPRPILRTPGPPRLRAAHRHEEEVPLTGKHGFPLLLIAPRASRDTGPGPRAASAARIASSAGGTTTSSSSSIENSRAPRMTGSWISTSSSERPREVGAEDHVYDVPVARLPHPGAIDSATAIGPSSCSASHNPELFTELAVERLPRASLPRRRRRPGSSQYSCPPSPAGKAAPVLPAHERETPDARRRPSPPRDPKPGRPLAIRELPDLDRLDLRDRHETSCAIRIPGSTTNVSRGRC